MRVLFDENVPRKLKWQIEAEVVNVPEMGWGGVKNGKLLQLAQAEFDVLLTLDKGIRHQQNLSGLEISLILVSSVSSDIDDLLPLVPSINRVLKDIQVGQIILVDV
ncbi:MAG: DUF5615 family PIN-like protein [Bacteroidetes bacterium]|nr:DUF5615 family PIN-like protein [Bacteroidota bacterium]